VVYCCFGCRQRSYCGHTCTHTHTQTHTKTHTCTPCCLFWYSCVRPVSMCRVCVVYCCFGCRQRSHCGTTHAHTHALLAANVGTLNVHMQGVCGLLLLWVPPEKLLSTHMHTHTHKHTQKHTHALLAAYFGTPACVLCPCAGCVWSTAALGAAREAIVERPMLRPYFVELVLAAATGTYVCMSVFGGG